MRPGFESHHGRFVREVIIMSAWWDNASLRHRWEVYQNHPSCWSKPFQRHQVEETVRKPSQDVSHRGRVCERADPIQKGWSHYLGLLIMMAGLALCIWSVTYNKDELATVVYRPTRKRTVNHYMCRFELYMFLCVHICMQWYVHVGACEKGYVL